MKEFTYVITDPLGIHARPAGEFVKVATTFPCSIVLEKDGKAMDAKSIMSVMSLCAKKNDTIILRCDGEKEDEAIEALTDFLKNNL